MEALRLRSADFRREREAQWLELEALVQLVERRGLRALAPAELHRLPALYRAAVSSLSVARAISLDKNVLDYLEALVLRAYFCVYGAKPRSGGLLRRFFGHSLPGTLRAHAGAVLLAFGLLIGGTLCGLAAVLADPEAYDAFVPAAMAQGRSPSSTTAELRAVLTSGAEESGSALGVFASFLFTHNAKIGLFSFALGFALGLPAVLLLFYNGLALGAMAGLYASRGLGAEFWAWVLPHGVTELTAVALCGGAGFMLAGAIVRPGRFGRLAALAQAGREATRLVLGAVLLFFVAALIEGIFRQRVHDPVVRWFVVALTAAGWLGYFVGWRPRPVPATESAP